MSRNAHSIYKCCLCSRELDPFTPWRKTDMFTGLMCSCWCDHCDVHVILLRSPEARFIGSQTWINDPFIHGVDDWLNPVKLDPN